LPSLGPLPWPWPLATRSGKTSSLRSGPTPPRLPKSAPSVSPTLPEVTVVAQGPSSLLTPGPEEAEAELREIPGGTNVVREEGYARGRVASLPDALSFQPGIYTAPTSTSGPSNNRISIRGSGIASPVFSNRGIYYLQDGIPWNRADGAAGDLGFLDLLSTQYVTIQRGAKAYEYGSATVGGAVNLVSRTGLSGPLFAFRGEAGSFGYLRGQLAGGAVEGNADFFASLSEFHMNGFRGHSEANDIYLNSNFALRPSPEVESRWYYTYMNLRSHFPSSLTLKEAKADPEATDPAFVLMDLRRFQDFHRLANRTAIRVDGDTFLELGLWWSNMWIWHPVFVFLHGSTKDFGALVRARTQGELFGLPNFFTTGLIPQGQFYKQVQDRMFFGLPIDGPRRSRTDAVATNLALYAEARLALTQDLSLVGALQLDHPYRTAKRSTSRRAWMLPVPGTSTGSIPS
jgi:iron complex outermembrane receptor protein